MDFTTSSTSTNGNLTSTVGCEEKIWLQAMTQVTLAIFILLGFGNLYTILALLMKEELRKKRFTILTITIAILDQLTCLFVIPGEIIILSCDVFITEKITYACVYTRMLSSPLVFTSFTLTAILGYVRHFLVLGGNNASLKWKWVILSIMASFAVGGLLFSAVYISYTRSCAGQHHLEANVGAVLLRILAIVLACAIYPFTYIKLRMRRNQSVGQAGLPVISQFQTITFATGLLMVIVGSIALILAPIVWHAYPELESDLITTVAVRSFRYIQSFINPIIYVCLYKPYRTAFLELFQKIRNYLQSVNAA